MRKTFLKVSLFSLLTVGMAASFTACKDYDDDINKTNQTVADLNTQLSAQIKALDAKIEEYKTASSNAATNAQKALEAAQKAQETGNEALAEAKKAQAAAELAAQAAADAKAEAAKELKAQVEALQAQINNANTVNEQQAKDLISLNERLNTLEKNFSTLDKALKDLDVEALLGSALASYTKKAELDAAINALKTQYVAVETYNKEIGNIKDLISGNYTELDGKISAAKTELTGLISDLEEKVNALEDRLDLIEGNYADLTETLDWLQDTKLPVIEQMINNITPNLVTMLGNYLRSMVFIPDLYFEGIEGTRYSFADGSFVSPKLMETTGTTAATSAAEPNNNTTYRIDNKTNWWYELTTNAYNLPQLNAIMSYQINPSSARTDVATFAYTWLNREYVTAPSRAAGDLAINFIEGTKNEETKAFDVNYTIDNAKKLLWITNNDENNVTVAALQATQTIEYDGMEEEGTPEMVTSDYAAIIPNVIVLKAIATNATIVGETKFTSDPAATATAGYAQKNAINDNPDKSDLWATGKLAAEQNGNSIIPVWYNTTGYNLKNTLSIHYTSADFKAPEATAEHKTMTLAEAEEMFGLTVSFSMMDYFTGDNKTSESLYGKIDATTGVYLPQWVSGTVDNPVQNNVSVDENQGRSCVNRFPIVCVVLKDANNNVVLSGYVKIQNVEQEPATPEDVVIDFPTNIVVPYTCDGFQNGTTWVFMSGTVLDETLHITRAEFVKNFEYQKGETYLKSGETMTLVTGNVYGDIAYNQDAMTTQNNGVLTWTGDFDALEAVYAANDQHSITLYGKFIYAKGTPQEYALYIGIPVTILPWPEVTYGEHILKLWYPTTQANAALRDTVRLNVPVPDAGKNNNVEEYKNEFDAFFVGNKVKISTTNTNYNLTALGTAYTYAFDSNQAAVTGPDGNTYKLSVSTDGLAVYLDTPYVAYDETEDADNSASNEVAKITDPATGAISYRPTTAGKTYLNLWGHNESKGRQSFAKVIIKGTYDKCLIPVNTGNFNARFLRPVDILDNDDAQFVDGTANGNKLSLGSLFNLFDWRDRPIFERNAATGLVSGYIDNGYDNLYTFYEFESIDIDLANVKTDLNGNSDDLLSAITQKLALEVRDDKGKEITPNAKNVVNVGIEQIDALNDNSLFYINNGYNVQTFHLYIPVAVNYYWGTVKASVTITVKKTTAQEGGNTRR